MLPIEVQYRIVHQFHDPGSETIQNLGIRYRLVSPAPVIESGVYKKAA